MLAVLILHVCLVTGLGCRDVTPPTLQQDTLVSCAILGERKALDWLNDHPKWVLRGWGCQVGQRKEPT